MKKPTLCLIFGGKSSEHEVSLRSFLNVYRELNNGSYKIINIGITKEGKWLLYKGNGDSILSGAWERKSKTPVKLDINKGALLIGKKRVKPDIVFPILHGENYEDGKIQGLLDIAGIKYAGCDTFASSISFDKEITKIVASSLGIKTAKSTLLVTGKEENEEGLAFFLEKTPFPLFVKPTMAGSSIGVSEARDKRELNEAIERAFRVSKRVLVEEKIIGTETEIAILEIDGKPTFSTPGQIKHEGDFYSYYEKYKNDTTELIIPAKISEETKKELTTCAKKLYYALGISGLCRMDFFVCENGDIVFNEVNTMPGFTDGSMFSMLFLAEGISKSEILNNILNI